MLVRYDPKLPDDNEEVTTLNEVVRGSNPDCENVSLLNKKKPAKWSSACCVPIYLFLYTNCTICIYSLRWLKEQILSFATSDKMDKRKNHELQGPQCGPLYLSLMTSTCSIVHPHKVYSIEV